ncbi:uncharacterized protein ARMOST_22531 [Armillaria ostoyae]|uniref:Uncharacterized protein n=1 Tax=Armillaria ostoyae TaxID=47428 RepID=A0A284SD54_ARMOS|nr:uncharacterized protein ARMOST_22531 [Armillaria ostoyae]
MPPQDHPTFPEPPCHWNDPPLPRNMAGTYSLATTVHRPCPTHLNPSQHIPQIGIAPEWTVPTLPGPPTGTRYHPHDHPTSPLPPGQWLSSDSNTKNPFTLRQRRIEPLREVIIIHDSPSPPPVPPRANDNPLNPNGPDYEWPILSAVDRQILGPHRSQAWEL